MRTVLVTAGALCVLAGLAWIHATVTSPGAYTDTEWHVDLLALGLLGAIVGSVVVADDARRGRRGRE